MTTLAPSQLQPVLDRGTADPVWKAKHAFGFHAWSKQRDILRSVRTNSKTAVQACHGVGKTAVAARVVLDFITEGPCRIITTAPTWAQVEELLWREIAAGCRAADKAGLPVGGRLTQAKLELREDWVAIGLSTDQPERFQGHHAPRLLLVVDEASGVDEAIFEAAEGFQTADGARMLMIGNPTRPTGMFHRACTSQSDAWNVIRMSVFDSPNYTDEEVPAAVARALPKATWAADMAEEWGEDDPRYKIRVLGEFALISGRAFFRNTFDPIDPVRRGTLVGEPLHGGAIQFVPQPDGALKVWNAPERGVRYVVFVDTAGGVDDDSFDQREAKHGSGSGDDYGCAMVVDCRTGEQVAELHGRWEHNEYARMVARLGRLYHDAVVAVEKNGVGEAVISWLRRGFEYPNLYTRRVVDSRTQSVTNTFGYVTTGTSRERMLATLSAVVKDSPGLLKSESLRDEMTTFVWSKRGKAEADAGCHDDRVMAMAGALEVWREHVQAPIVLAPRKKQRPLMAADRRAARVA